MYLMPIFHGPSASKGSAAGVVRLVGFGLSRPFTFYSECASCALLPTLLTPLICCFLSVPTTNCTAVIPQSVLLWLPFFPKTMHPSKTGTMSFYFYVPGVLAQS